MKVFLTGATGILGTAIAEQLQLRNKEYLPFDSSSIQLGNYSDVKLKIKDFKPDVVIHCAAMTNVDLCEDDKDSAILINTLGTQNIAAAAAQINAKVVYISSCGVYGQGKVQPYNEYDATNPQTYHHFTKLEGEKRVKELNNQFIIVRPGWLFGGTLQHRKNFVEARRREASKLTTINSAVDKIGSPTYTSDLAKQLFYLIDNDYSGTFNMVNEGYASRFGYVSEIINLLGLQTQVEPVNSDIFPRKANMPDNECLENYNLNLLQINQMRDWKEALKEYVTNTYQL